jgi:hypothetical protein
VWTKLAVVVVSLPFVLLLGVVAEALGGSPFVVWIPWLAVVLVAFLPLRAAADVEGFDPELFRKGAPAPVRPKGDKGLKPVARLTGTDPFDALWGTTSRFPVAPDDLGEENPYHLRIDEDPEGDEPPR